MNTRLLIPVSAMFLLSACGVSVNKPVPPTPTPQAQATQVPLVMDAYSPIATQAAQATTTTERQSMATAVITTSKGDITIELYADSAPGTVANFQKKAASGYYSNLTFHRVEDWVIQGGDPKGNGTGGGQMPTELSAVPFVEGSVGVARGGDIRVSNDSQFFICTTDCSWLTGQYTNFGKVTQGMDVVKKIAIGDKITKITYSE